MANEITMSASLNLTRTSPVEEVNWDTGALNATQTGTRYAKASQTINTTGVALQVNAGTVGYTLIRNQGTGTQSIVYLVTTTGATTGAAFISLSAGEISLYKAGALTQTPYGLTSTGTSTVEVLTIEL
jgi:hypothetical protein